MVAAVSGEPYAQYVENHILRPLGMSSTSVTPQPGDPNLAVGYRRRVLPTRRSGPVRPGVGTSGERRFPRVLAISRGVGLPAVNQKGERTRSGLIWLRR